MSDPKHPLGPALRDYFCSYLIGQRDLSPRTISTYRDTFRLLLRFLERRYHLDSETVSVEGLPPGRPTPGVQGMGAATGSVGLFERQHARCAAAAEALRDQSRAWRPEPLSSGHLWPSPRPGLYRFFISACWTPSPVVRSTYAPDAWNQE